jgi:hypothetical protein
MGKLGAQLDGPGGAFIRSIRASRGEEMKITFHIWTDEVDISETSASAVLDEISNHLSDLNKGLHWLAAVGADMESLKRTLLAKERQFGSIIDEQVSVAIKDIYSEMINQQLADTFRIQAMRYAPPPPMAFDKSQMMKVVAEARAIARKAGLDPVNRWMLAVRSVNEVWKMFPHAEPSDEDPNLDPEGGVYGHLQGLKVTIDPDIEGWELRDSITGEKIQFVENPDQPGVRYYFDTSTLNPDSPTTHFKIGGVNDDS